MSEQQVQYEAMPVPMTDEQIAQLVAGEVCPACGGRKCADQAFCPTDFIALTVWMRRCMSMGVKHPEFVGNFRGALRHLQLNPQRKKNIPVRAGEWPYSTDEELEKAGFKFLNHAHCSVPGCHVRIEWYRTPRGACIAVNLADYQRHSLSCADPMYFQKRREERAQTSARKKLQKKKRRKV
ncbi:MAG: hypothetical protein JWO13_2258 [Acidobacteriales bacterium]|nr:hypothetical protein [Terriglobales bacterium]